MCFIKCFPLFGILEPETFSGHTSNLKKCLWLEGDRRFVSISDDKSVR